MSEVRLVVRELNRDWSGIIHGSCADQAIAALSADPVTLDELQDSVVRYAKPVPGSRFFANLKPGLCAEPYDAGLVVIDLAAKLVVVNSTYSSLETAGGIEYHNGHCCTETVLPYHVADDWQFANELVDWRHLADRRRQEQTGKPLLDARPVLFGPPLLEFIARQTFAAFARRNEIATSVRARWTEEARQRFAKKAGVGPDQVAADAVTEEEIIPNNYSGDDFHCSPFYDTIKQIHADWLLTPREDLGGRCPREVAVDRRNHIMWDMQDRCEYWSLLGHCAPGLKKTSHAYRFGGMGTHELVEYYDLIRELLWSCWDQLTEKSQEQRLDSLTAGDFLTAEMPRLEKVRETWLDTPDPECHGRTPRSIIERERLRLPEGVSGHEAMIDHDCPCCQAMADMPGPYFWGLDGCNMDDDFAFDINCRTRAEWEEEQRSREEFNRRFDAESAERKRLGVDSQTGAGDSKSIWSRSFHVADTADVPLGVRVFGVGCHLAEIIVRLREGSDRDSISQETQSYIDTLNRDFGNLREILQSADTSLSEALVGPVMDQFAETLNQVATGRPKLEPHCEELADEIKKLLAPPPQEPNWDAGDNDIPF
jgi:hypothetical protein